VGGRSAKRSAAPYRLKTDTAEIVRALQLVLHRGSLRAAEEQTGHNYETIAVWVKCLGDHAEAITGILARDMHLLVVELDELWSFVDKKGEARSRRTIPSRFWQKARVSTGDA
jgi:hypothetical protein